MLTVEQIVSGDGYAADPGGGLEFVHAADFGDESRTDSEQMEWLRTVDAILLGAPTYRMIAGSWQSADPSAVAVAQPITASPSTSGRARSSGRRGQRRDRDPPRRRHRARR